jgi:hypothetical protein
VVFQDAYAVNATDAVLVQAALDYAASLRAHADDLAVVLSDQRLRKACLSEGLLAFDPETQSQADLDALIAS